MVLVISGVVFILQSKSVLGPTSSFMYSNSEWTINGYIIIATGIIISALGITLWRQYSNKDASSYRL
jgi:hypothetical protein